MLKKCQSFSSSRKLIWSRFPCL